jgi:hypothetical protein
MVAFAPGGKPWPAGPGRRYADPVDSAVLALKCFGSSPKLSASAPEQHLLAGNDEYLTGWPKS